MDYYKNKIEWLESIGYKELSPYEYYRMMFPIGSFQTTDESNGDFKPNGLILFRNTGDEDNRMHTGIIYDELDTVTECINREGRYADHEFVIVSGCSYIGRRKRNKDARYCYAIIIDVDQVDKSQLANIIGMAESKMIPMPTAIVVSGNGVHVVYMLFEPIRLYPKQLEALNQVKSLLIRKIWNANTSLDRNVQYQGVVQGYRMVGTKTKKGHITKAFLTGNKVCIDDLILATEEMNVPFLVPARELNNGTIDHSIYSKTIKKCLNEKDFQQNLLDLFIDSITKCTLEEAKNKYPDWYQRRIVEKQPKGIIKFNDSVYTKWLATIREKAKAGNRRTCLICLAACAQKCMIPEDRFVKDVESLIPVFDSRSVDESNRFTEKDGKRIISLYKSNDYSKLKFSTFEKMTGIKYPLKKKKKSSINSVGRPNIKNVVMKYISDNPSETNKSKIARECNCSRQTVAKYLKLNDDNNNSSIL